MVGPHCFCAGAGGHSCRGDAQEGVGGCGGDSQGGGYPPQEGLQQIGPPGGSPAPHALPHLPRGNHWGLTWQLLTTRSCLSVSYTKLLLHAELTWLLLTTCMGLVSKVREAAASC